MCRIDWTAAANAADELLARAGVRKALDPLDPNDFVLISAKLARELESIRRRVTAADIQRAMDSLDVDWASMSAPAQDVVVRAVNTAVRAADLRALPDVQARLEVAASTMIDDSMHAASVVLNVDIGLSTDLVDKRVAAAAARQDVYFRDELGRRADAFTGQGQAIIQRGLEQGLRSGDIAAELRAAAASAHLNRSEHYFRVVASQAMNGARTYGMLRSFEAAGIQTFKFEAVLDERTTEACRMLDGVEFRVGPAVARFQTIADSPDPEAVLDLKPWVRERRDAEGNKELYVRDRNGIETTIATVTRPAFGRVDAVGEYELKVSIPTMDQLGVSYPPLHALCRSTIVPGDELDAAELYE